MSGGAAAAESACEGSELAGALLVDDAAAADADTATAGAAELPQLPAGWPSEPFDPEVLRQYVLKVSREAKITESLRGRRRKVENELARRATTVSDLASAAVAEGLNPKIEVVDGIDPNAYLLGRWYRFLNCDEDCWLYVHNYTRDITGQRPSNFTEMTEEEKALLKKLGTHMQALPEMVETIYSRRKSIPLIFASPSTSDALRSFFTYDTYGQLLDTTKLKRITQKGLEDARLAIVTAMKHGKTLCIYIGEYICDFYDKVCIPKNRKFFPVQLFSHGGVLQPHVKDALYRDEDKDDGECKVSPGFRICVVVSYDNYNFAMTSFGKDNLRLIPDVDNMEEVRVYNDEDKKKLLERFAQ